MKGNFSILIFKKETQPQRSRENGLTDRQTDGQTDRQTDRHNFLKYPIDVQKYTDIESKSGRQH